MIDTARCHDCKRLFPDHLIQTLTLITDNKLISKKICPICALEIRNKEYGLTQDYFNAPMANNALNQARKYLEEKKQNK